MNSTTFKLFTAITVCAALAIPVQLAAQNDSAPTNSAKRHHYKLTVLDTLGGTFGEAWGVNNRGSMVGHSTLPGDATYHAFFLEEGLITDLGSLGGQYSNNSSTSPINDRGEVSGFSDTATPDPNGEDFCQFGTALICLPFVWREGVMTVT